MFNPTPEREQFFKKIYQDRRKQGPSYRIEDVLYMAVLISEGHLSESDNPLYWRFMESILGHIETGKWDAHPSLWRTHLESLPVTPLTPEAIVRARDSYITKRNIMLRGRNLPSTQSGLQQAIVAWCLSMAGIDAMFDAIRLIFDLNFIDKGKTK